MKRLFILMLIAINANFLLGQTKWIKIENPVGDFIQTVSLHPHDHQYHMPCYGCVQENTGRFNVVDFYVNQDCKRFKIRATYCDLACLDTSDLTNYFQVQYMPVMIFDSSSRSYRYADDDLINKSNLPYIDTNQNRNLVKEIDGKLFALRYYWNQPDTGKSLLKRVSGNFTAYIYENLKTNGVIMFPQLGWNGQQYKPELSYVSENLQYVLPGDTFEVYGRLKDQSIAYRTQMLRFNSEHLRYYDPNLNAFVISYVDELYNPQTKVWTANIKFHNPKPIVVAPFTLHFKNMDALQLPKLFCDDENVEVQLVKDKESRYGLALKVNSVNQLNRVVKVKLENLNGTTTKFKIDLVFQPVQ